MDKFYRTGEPAPQSGIFAVYNRRRQPIGPTISVARNEAFPKFQNSIAWFQLNHPVAQTITTSTSSSEIASVTVLFPHTLDYLAKR
jgi:hypothetical protein